MRTKLLTSMAATLLLVGVGSVAVAATGVEADTTGVADEVVAGDQDQLRLRDRDELCELIGDGEQYRHASTECSPTTVDSDRDQDEIRDLDRDRTRDQLRDDSCEPDGNLQRDRDRNRDCMGLTGAPAGGTLAPVGERVRTQTRVQVLTQAVAPEPTREQAQVQSREQVQTSNQTRYQAQIQTQDPTEEPAQEREETQIVTRVQEESQHHSREQAGAPDARGQH